MVIFKKEKGNNVNNANNNNSHNLSGTFCERNTVFKPYHVIPIIVLGGWLASCKWHHYGSGNWDSEIFSSLPMFPQPVIGKAGFRQDLPPEPTRLTITPCFLWSKTGPVLGLSRGPCRTVATHHFCWSRFNLSQPIRRAVLSAPWHPLRGPLSTDGAEYVCLSQMLVLGPLPNLPRPPRSRWQWLCIRVYSVPFHN